MILGLLIPIIGTSLGAGCVLFMKKQISSKTQRVLSGFAAGVMVAASVWSLLLPSIDYASHMGNWAFVPASVGFLLGIVFLQALDRIIPMVQCRDGGEISRLPKTTVLVMSVTLHNIPEGMAVGVAYAGYLSGKSEFTLAAALVLSIGIAIQNFPEGSIISMPLKAQGMNKGKAFGIGVLSGIVEPIGAFLTILAASIVVPVLPYFLSFAAGAMFYVVVEELIPEMTQGSRSNIGTMAFTIGFCIMMMLDVALG